MRAHEFTKPILLEYKREITIANPKTRVAIVKRMFQTTEDTQLARSWTRDDITLHANIHNIFKPKLEKLKNEMDNDDPQISDYFRKFREQRVRDAEKNIERSESLLKTSNKHNSESTPWLDDELKDIFKKVQLETDRWRQVTQLGKLGNLDGGINIDVDVLANTFMRELESYDPTSNKKYVPWMLQQYLKNNVKRIEDMSGVNEILEKYDRVKKLRGFPDKAKDITKLDYDTLRTLVRKFDPDDPNEYSQNMGDYDVIYGEIDVRTDEYGLLRATPKTDVVVVHPKDEAAGIYFGRVFGGFAEWCTAYVPPRTNMFSYYNRQGPMYVIVPKIPRYTNEKFQVHDASNQFADENDDHISLQNLFLVRFPQLKELAPSLVPKQNLQYKISFNDDSTILDIWKIIGEGAIYLVENSFKHYSGNITKLLRSLPPEEQYKLKKIVLENLDNTINMDIDAIRKVISTYQNRQGQLLGIGDLLFVFEMTLVGNPAMSRDQYLRSFSYELNRFLTISPKSTGITGRVIGVVGDYKIILDV